MISNDIIKNNKKIRQVALSYLAKSEYTRFTLREKLLRKGFLHQVVEAALDSLAQQGFLDDARFCEVFIARRVRQGYGPIRILAECRQYGINEEIITSQLQQDEEFWLTVINAVWQKKKFSADNSSQQEQLRQIRYLQYRGFRLDQIKESQKNYLSNKTALIK